MSRVIAISNQKGGVGKTTTTINLAAFLALNGHRVLLIDMDSQANAGSGLGVYPQNVAESLYDVLVQDTLLSKATYSTEIKLLSIVPAKQNLAGAEIELVPAFAREFRLKEALKEVDDLFDFILLDTPPTLGLLTINALTAADSILIPLQAEYYAMEGLSQLIKTISLIQKRLNPSLVKEGILLTMVDRRNNLSHQVESEIRRHFPGEVYQSVIPRNVKLSEAPSYGKPAPLYDKNSAGSQAYWEFTCEFLRRQKVSISSNLHGTIQ